MGCKGVGGFYLVFWFINFLKFLGSSEIILIFLSFWKGKSVFFV